MDTGIWIHRLTHLMLCWLALQEALFRLWKSPRVFTCARQGCLATVERGDGHELGAHIKISLEAELGKLIGVGGTAVVPLCTKHHNCRGERIELAETKALLDMGSPLDLRGMRSTFD